MKNYKSKFIESDETSKESVELIEKIKQFRSLLEEYDYSVFNEDDKMSIYTELDELSTTIINDMDALLGDAE